MVTALRQDLEAAQDECKISNSRVQNLEDQLTAKACLETTENEILAKVIEEKVAEIKNLEVKVCELKEEKTSLGR